MMRFQVGASWRWYLLGSGLLERACLRAGRVSRRWLICTRKGATERSARRKSTHQFWYPGATPAVSANGTHNGIVWLIETKAWNDFQPSHCRLCGPTTRAIYRKNSTISEENGLRIVRAAMRFAFRPLRTDVFTLARREKWTSTGFCRSRLAPVKRYFPFL